MNSIRNFKIIFILLLVVWQLPVTADPVIGEDYRAIWLFNENSGIIAADSSGNTFSAQLFNTLWAEGVAGSALALYDADSYALLPGSLENGLEDSTISLWVNWQDTLSRKDARILTLSTGDVNDPGSSYLYITPANSETGTLRVAFSLAGTGINGILDGPEALAYDRWTHILLVFDDGLLRLYIDGSEVNTFATLFTPGTLGASLNYIGNYQSGGLMFQGFVDELRCIRRAVTPEEAAALGRIITISTVDERVWEEGEKPGAFSIARPIAGDSDLVVSYQTGGTAIPEEDYEELPGSITIPAGETEIFLMVQPYDDLMLEGNERISVILDESMNYITGQPDPVEMIIDDSSSKRRLDAWPAAIDFGRLYVGDTCSLSLNLSNNGEETTTIYHVEFSDPAFSLEEAIPVTISSLDSQYLTIVYTPTARGIDTYSMIIYSDAEDQPVLDISLTAEASMPPRLTVNPSDYFITAGMSAIVEKEMSLTNSGDEDVSFTMHCKSTDPDFPGPVQNYITSRESTGTIAPGGVMQNILSFNTRSLDAGLYNFVVEIQHNDPLKENPFIIPCRLEVTPEKYLTAATSAISFNILLVGNWYTRTIYLENNGNAPVTLFSVTSGDPVFNCYSDLPRIINPGEQGAVAMGFLSGEPKTYEEFVVIESDADDNPVLSIPWSATVSLPRQIDPITSSLDLTLDPNTLTTLQVSFTNSSTHFTTTGSLAVVSPWLNSPVEEWQIPPLGNKEVILDINTGWLLPGSYQAGIKVTHNALNRTSPFTIPVNLTINEYRKISASPVNHIGDGLLNEVNYLSITFVNPGNCKTLISDISFDNSVFAYPATFPREIPAYGNIVIYITVTPETLGDQVTTMVIHSDARDNPILEVEVHARGITPPGLAFSEPSIDITLDPYTTGTVPLTLINDGGSELDYTAQIIYDETLPEAVDAFGYTCTESSSYGGGPEFIWDDISSVGKRLSVLDYATVTMSFNFPFYGNSFNTVRVAERGFLCFDNVTSVPSIPVSLPHTWALPDLIAVFYTTLDLTRGGDIYALDTGDSLIIQYEHMDFSIGGYFIVGDLTFQVVLHKDGTINFYYKSMVINEGEAYVEFKVGMQNSTADIGFELDHYPYWYRYERAVEITPPRQQWLTIPRTSGRVDLLSSEDFTVNMAAQDLPAGTYNAVVKFSHNSPTLPDPYDYPVSMTVNSSKQLSAPALIDLGSTLMKNLPVVDAICLENSGSSEITVDSITCDNSSFIIDTPVPFTLGPYQKRYILFTFSPPDRGIYTAQVVFGNDSGNAPQLPVTLKGEGYIPQQLTLSPGDIDEYLAFNETREVRIKAENTGDRTLRISYFIDRTPPWMSLNTGSDPSSMNPGQYYYLEPGEYYFVDLVLNSADLYADTDMDYGILSFYHTDPAQTYPVKLYVNVEIEYAYFLRSDRTALDFPSTMVGESTSLPLTLYNDGNIETYVYGVIFDNPSFSCHQSWVLEVPAFGSETIEIKYTPVVSGPAGGTLTVESDALDNPWIDIGLTAHAFNPNFDVAPRDFSTMLENDTTGTATLDLSNEGNDPVVFSVAAGAAWLSVTPSSGTLAPGSGMSLEVTFDSNPVDYGIHETELVITHDGSTPASPILIPCSLVVNRPPAAHFSYSPALPFAGVPVLFDGSLSSDSDGIICHYEWDLDGDGLFDDATGVEVSWSFPAGQYTVSLQVTDDHGSNSSFSQTITITDTILPYFEDFEDGFGTEWTTYSDNYGRIQLTSSYTPYDGNSHCVMDSAYSGGYALNEMVLRLNLAGQSDLKLSFAAKGFSDEANPLPASFTGRYDGDGVAVSHNGTTWYTVQSLAGLSSSWTEFVIDLDGAIQNAGINYTENFYIKFQQYDNYPATTDGIAFDSIMVKKSGIRTILVEDFEDSLPTCWTTRSTANGQILFASGGAPAQGAYYCLMDAKSDGTYALNELILETDISGKNGLFLSFYVKEFAEEDDPMPTSFSGSYYGDGVSFSVDGTTWYTLESLTGSNISSSWVEHTIDLDAAIAAAGVSGPGTFFIKFQQYDNYTYPTDGMAFDVIKLYTGL